MTPKYVKKLPFIQQLQYSIKNLFKSTLAIRQERLESVQTFISDLCVVFSAEDAYAIGRALETLQRDYDEKCQKAQKSPKSVLYTTMQRLMTGPIAELIRYFPVQEPTPSQQQEKPVPKQEKLIELEQSHHQTQQKQEDLATQVEELKKELAQKDTEWQKKLAQKDAGWVTRFSQFFTSVTEPELDSRSTTASNEERSENSHNTRFFKP